MDAGLREFVQNRAFGLCEYCRMPDEFDPLPFCIDHIISQQHHGPTAESNLALSCFNWHRQAVPNFGGGLAGLNVKQRLAELEKAGREMPADPREAAAPRVAQPRLQLPAGAIRVMTFSR